MGRKSENKEKYGMTKVELKKYEATYKKNLNQYNRNKKSVLFLIIFLIIGICCVLFIPHTAGVIAGWILIGYNGLNLFLIGILGLMLTLYKKLLKRRGSDVE